MFTPKKSMTRLGCALVGATLALTLSACSNDGVDGGAMNSDGMSGNPMSSSDSQDVNEADVTFAQQMIPHHQQALMMAAMAKRSAESADVRELAQRIQDAQQPEIDLMTGWLESWDEEVSDLGMMDHDMMGHGDDGGMQGMMSGSMLRAMRNANGVTFDLMWLRGMIEHHEGAITMAQEEQQTGVNPDAIDLAGAIEDAQSEEVAYMRELITQLR